MVLCDTSVISFTCKFLGQSPPGNVSFHPDGTVFLELKDGRSVRGFGPVLETIIRSHKKSLDLIPASPEEYAQLRQWLEFFISVVNFGDSQSAALKTLNERLSRVNFLIGSRVTVADAILYFIIFATMDAASMHEKENLCHVSRWLSTVQHHPGLLVSPDFKLLTFSRNHLYKI